MAKYGLKNKSAAHKHKAASDHGHQVATAKAKTKPSPKSAGTGTKVVDSQPGKTHEPAPVAPTRVDPFFTADDLTQINAFATDFYTKLADIDSQLESLRTDTNYEKTTNDHNAKQSTSNAAESMVERGLFSSSIKDAALYDIEANRALANKFLDDKVISATLNAGTQKSILATSKTNFDKAMKDKAVANAKGINDDNAGAWADLMATWKKDNPDLPDVDPATSAAPTSTAASEAPAPGWRNFTHPNGLPGPKRLAAPAPLASNTQQATAAHAHGLAVARAKAKPRKLAGPRKPGKPRAY